MVIDSAPGVGEKGGKCTCGDGTSYDVGAIDNDCKKLACISGTSSQCFKTKGNWSGKKVICGQVSYLS